MIACVISFFTLKETYAPVLLRAKAQRIQKEAGHYGINSKATERAALWPQLKVAIVRPLKLLFLMPVVTLEALHVAVVYGIMYLLISTFTYVFLQQYHFDQGSSGLTFLPAGIGMMIGVATFGQLTDFMIKRDIANGITLRPERRISPILIIPSGLTLPTGLFIYGWTSQYGVHWIVPMLGVVIFCIGLMGIMVCCIILTCSLRSQLSFSADVFPPSQMCVQSYLLDAYPQYAASVTAAMTVLRSLAGALLPLGGLEMYYALGLGWGNSLLAFIALTLVPIPLIFYKFGEGMRAKQSSTSAKL